MLRPLHRDGDPGDVNDEAQYKDDRDEDGRADRENQKSHERNVQPMPSEWFGIASFGHFRRPPRGYTPGPRYAFALSPSSTRRRMASESEGMSGCFSAHLTIEARITGSARNPIRGVMPLRGRPMTFCLTGIVFFILFV